MKFLHIADLHFGKYLEKQSLEEDQEFWIGRFLELVDKERPGAVLMAGDIYDTKQGSESATRLLGLLLEELHKRDVTVCIVAGNHDSAERLSAHAKLFQELNIHISEPLSKTGGVLHKVELEDEAGPVNVWLMPYVWNGLVKTIFSEEIKSDSYEEAVRVLLSHQNIDKAERNVLVAHQNVTADGVEVEKGGSESKFIGGVGPVDYKTFDDFDYVALGHIHSPVPVGREAVRYAGSNLCYHFDELRQANRGVVLVDMGKKGDELGISQLPLPALHPLKQIEAPLGDVDALIKSQIVANDYVQIVVAPEDDLSPMKKQWLRQLCEEQGAKLMQVFRAKSQTEENFQMASREQINQKDLLDLFADFYESKTSRPVSEEDWALLELIREQMARSGVQEDASPGEALTGGDGEPSADKDAEELIAFLLSQEESHETD